MTDTKAPERIWAFPKKGRWFNAGASSHQIKAAGAKDVEYVRKDLHDTLRAENERLKAALGGIDGSCSDFLTEPDAEPYQWVNAVEMIQRIARATLAGEEQK